MSKRLGDFFSAVFLASVVAFLLYRPTHQVFVELSTVHPYLMGFLKVGILATFGEILSARIKNGYYKIPVGLFYRFIIWGFLGMVFVFTFELFFSGTRTLLEKNLLPYLRSQAKFFNAFYSSVLMNLIFAPTFMSLHRITDTYIELGEGKISKIFSLRLENVVKSVQWDKFVGFVVLKTIPFFWIPAHTITFLLPSTYRVLTAALLSIVLGVLLSLKKN